MRFQRMGRNTGVIAPDLMQKNIARHHMFGGAVQKF